MKVSEMILELKQILAEHGDLPIVGGYITDDRGPEQLTLVDDDGCDAISQGTKPTGVFLE